MFSFAAFIGEACLRLWSWFFPKKSLDQSAVNQQQKMDRESLGDQPESETVKELDDGTF